MIVFPLVENVLLASPASAFLVLAVVAGPAVAGLVAQVAELVPAVDPVVVLYLPVLDTLPVAPPLDVAAYVLPVPVLSVDDVRAVGPAALSLQVLPAVLSAAAVTADVHQLTDLVVAPEIHALAVGPAVELVLVLDVAEALVFLLL